ncbi:hypothetical protein B0H11DRAFT_1934758 [Mycena galericulata]|nr:hypothetical protein B0H11DRAFT_1934758 [Mycena galericulata]
MDFLPFTPLPPAPPQPTTVLERMRWTFINFVRHSIKVASPRYGTIKSAWLFPDGDIVRRRVWIGVPVVRGVKTAVCVEKMETEMWIDCARGGSSTAVDYGARSITVKRFPFDSTRDLKYAFTIVVSTQRNEGPNVYPENELINRMMPDLPRPWRGNVLVFKHGITSKRRIIHISESDGFCETASWSDNSMDRVMPFPAHETSAEANTQFRDQFARSRDLVDRVLGYLPLLSLLKYAMLSKGTLTTSFPSLDAPERNPTSSGTASSAKSRLKSRTLRYTRPFFADERTHIMFFHCLEDLASWIVGSVPLAVLSLCGEPRCPDNLNIITVEANLEPWFNFMVNVLQFELIENITCGGVYGPVATRFLRFVHTTVPMGQGKSITITASAAKHFFDLYFAVPNTIQSCFISATEIGTPYVEMTSNHEGTFSWFQTAWENTLTHEPIDDETPVESPFQGIVDLQRSTAAWDRPCGLACPGKWRFANGLRGFGHWKWGSVDDMDWDTDPVVIALGNSRVKWRSGLGCGIDSIVEHICISQLLPAEGPRESLLPEACPPQYKQAPAKMAPSILPLTNNASIQNTEATFSLNNARYKTFYDALLFPTGEHLPVRVRVPAFAAPIANNLLGRLDYMPWLSPAPEGGFRNHAATDIGIESSDGTRFFFTVFHADQIVPFLSTVYIHPPNTIIDRMLDKRVKHWRGNMLVMRRTSGGVDYKHTPSIHKYFWILYYHNVLGQIAGIFKLVKAWHAIGHPHEDPVVASHVIKTVSCTLDLITQLHLISHHINALLDFADEAHFHALVQLRGKAKELYKFYQVIGSDDQLMMEGREIMYKRQTPMHRDMQDPKKGWAVLVVGTIKWRKHADRGRQRPDPVHAWRHDPDPWSLA